MKRGKVLLTTQKKFELSKLELKSNIKIIKYGLSELEIIFVVKNTELNNVKQQIRDIRRYNETKLFDFKDIPKDEVINLKQFLHIAGINVVLYENQPIFNIIVDAS